MDRRELSTILFTVYLLTGSVVTGSDKKGVGMAPAQFKCDDFKALNKMKWWYDWTASGVKLRNKHDCSDFDDIVAMHIPMAWGNGSQFPNYFIQPTARYLLGFNEPNHQAQSNLSAAQAIELWPHLMNLAKEHNLILVSPAAAPCGKNCRGDAIEWFDEFFRLCKEQNVGDNGDCGVVHVATHVYYCDPDRVMNYLQELWDKYQKPIWVTEFACPDETDPAVVLDFMKAVLPRLEEASHVFRFAWYISRIVTDNMYVKSAVSLLKQDSSALTALGRYYNEFGEETLTTTTTSTTTSTTTTSATTPTTATSATTPTTATSATTSTTSTTASSSTSTSTSAATTGTTSTSTSQTTSTKTLPNGIPPLLNKSNVCIVYIVFIYICFTFV